MMMLMPAVQPFEKISFFDQISTNKTRSAGLLFAMFALYLAVIWAFSYFFEIGPVGVGAGFFVLLAYAFVTYFAGDGIILGLSGARRITRDDFPYLFLTVEGLCAANGIKMPGLYIIEDPSPNAFVVGRSPDHSSLAVTRGLLERMDRDELAGVLAHEVSHIANYDIRFMLFAVVFAGAIAILGDIAWRSMRYGSSRREDRAGSGVAAIIAIILIILAPLFSELIRFAISRQREYLADANGARMTRRPDSLASALEKIAKINTPVAAATDATAPLYFARPLPGSFFHLFSTHPPIEERIKKLRAMG